MKVYIFIINTALLTPLFLYAPSALHHQQSTFCVRVVVVVALTKGFACRAHKNIMNNNKLTHVNILNRTIASLTNSHSVPSKAPLPASTSAPSPTVIDPSKLSGWVVGVRSFALQLFALLIAFFCVVLFVSRYFRFLLICVAVLLMPRYGC